MDRRYIPYAIAAVVALIVLANTFFIVDQREQAIVVRLGDPVRVINAGSEATAGLKVKVPFMEQVLRFDKRNLALATEEEEIIAADQERLVVDAFIRYRIDEPLQYYRTLRDDRTARDRIQRLVNSALREVLGSAPSSEIISGSRSGVMQRTLQDVRARATSSRLGIEVIDVRIRRADLPEANQAAVYRRMETSRQ
ncbi:MAG: protease modulator HflC, partial [Alphaproteobacteria bacterium]|nr:protease modulator HflC [Alphaproteobacteria bacterium]